MEEEGASRCYPRVITAVSSRFAARIGRKTRFWRILPTVHLGSRCSAIESRRSRPVGRSCGDLAAFRFVSKKQRERERERRRRRRKPGAILARAYLREETDRSGASFFYKEPIDRRRFSFAELFISSFRPLPLGLSRSARVPRTTVLHCSLHRYDHDHDQAAETSLKFRFQWTVLDSVWILFNDFVDPSDAWNKEKNHIALTHCRCLPRQLYKLFSRSRES